MHGEPVRFIVRNDTTLEFSGRPGALYNEAVRLSIRYDDLEPLTPASQAVSRQGALRLATDVQRASGRLPHYETLPHFVQLLMSERGAELHQQLEETVDENPFPFPPIPSTASRQLDASEYNMDDLPIPLAAPSHGEYLDAHLLEAVGPNVQIPWTDGEAAASQENLTLGMLAVCRAQQLLQNAHQPLHPTTRVAVLSELENSMRPLVEVYMRTVLARRRGEFRPEIPRREYIDRMAAPVLNSTVVNEQYLHAQIPLEVRGPDAAATSSYLQHAAADAATTDSDTDGVIVTTTAATDAPAGLGGGAVTSPK